jgi:four helix bundle suffix protein
MESFLPKKGDYRKLLAFQKAECIYDITAHFVERFLKKSDRTVDQMLQAARSGKQNIAEGSSASATSSETEIRLINVAKASLQELLLDYEDYLRVRGLEQWGTDDERTIKTREVGKHHNDSAFYREAIVKRSDETIANIAITLLHQEDYMLRNLLERLQDDFVKQGGIKEMMFKARTDYRQKKVAPNQNPKPNKKSEDNKKDPSPPTPPPL